MHEYIISNLRGLPMQVGLASDAGCNLIQREKSKIKFDWYEIKIRYTYRVRVCEAAH